jgi:formylglycine-generating enzyme required for sulfatase activity
MLVAIVLSILMGKSVFAGPISTVYKEVGLEGVRKILINDPVLAKADQKDRELLKELGKNDSEIRGLAYQMYMTPQRSYLSDVPVEALIAGIISNLDTPSLVHTSETCQGMDVLLTSEKAKKQIDYYRGKVIPVEGGKFEMGSPLTEDGRYNDGREDLHEKETLPIHLGETQVTQEMYLRVMGPVTGVNPSQYKNKTDCPDHYKEMTVEIEGQEKKIPYCEGHPVENLKKGQMEAYLTRLEGIIQPLWKIAYPRDLLVPHYVLPSEEQWEKATQEKLDQPDERGMTSKHVVYSGTNDVTKLDEYAVYATRKTAHVKLKDPNTRGFYGMSGNVWEVTSSKWAQDPTTPEEKRTGSGFVWRGGSWAFYDPRSLRASMRYEFSDVDASLHLGFRLGEVLK